MAGAPLCLASSLANSGLTIANLANVTPVGFTPQTYVSEGGGWRAASGEWRMAHSLLIIV